ncbi:MAG: hypothetical protein ACOCXJ_06345 [Planctomycetota bacterium]
MLLMLIGGNPRSWAAEGPVLDAGFGQGGGVQQINATAYGGIQPALLAVEEGGQLRFTQFLRFGLGITTAWYGMDLETGVLQEGPYGAPYRSWPAEELDPTIRSSVSQMDAAGRLTSARIRMDGSTPTTPLELLVERRRPDGLPDETFTAVVWTVGVADDEYVLRDIALSDSGILILAGRREAVDATRFRNLLVVWRIGIDGGFEADHGGTGQAELGITDRSVSPRELVADSSGACVVVGEEGAVYETGIGLIGFDDSTKAFVARFDAGGLPDAAFSDDGYHSVDHLGIPDDFDQAVLRPDGILIAAGETLDAPRSSGGTRRLLLAAFDATGPAAGLFTDAQTLVDIGPDSLKDAMLDGSGCLLVLANGADGGALWRFTDAGAPDPGFAAGSSFRWTVTEADRDRFLAVEATATDAGVGPPANLTATVPVDATTGDLPATVEVILVADGEAVRMIGYSLQSSPNTAPPP